MAEFGQDLPESSKTPRCTQRASHRCTHLHFALVASRSHARLRPELLNRRREGRSCSLAPPWGPQMEQPCVTYLNLSVGIGALAIEDGLLRPQARSHHIESCVASWSRASSARRGWIGPRRGRPWRALPPSTGGPSQVAAGRGLGLRMRREHQALQLDRQPRPGALHPIGALLSQGRRIEARACKAERCFQRPVGPVRAALARRGGRALRLGRRPDMTCALLSACSERRESVARAVGVAQRARSVTICRL